MITNLQSFIITIIYKKLIKSLSIISKTCFSDLSRYYF